jgi:hypothetical protein
MHYGKTRTLYREDATSVEARDYFLSPNAQLADGLITDDGRVVLCQDETKGIFWYRDTQERLYLDDPSVSS